MDKNNSNGNNKDFKEFLVDKTIVGLAFFAVTLGGLILLVPIFIWIGNVIAVYITCFCSIVLLALGFFFYIRGIEEVRNSFNKSVKDLSEQLDAFANADVAVSNARHDIPELQILQEKFNSSIKKYSRFRLIPNPDPISKKIVAKVASHFVFPLNEFKDLLAVELDRNTSFRSAVLLIKLEGENINEETQEKLHQKIIETFHECIIGKYDEKTFAVYIYNVAAVELLKYWAIYLVRTFNEYIVHDYDDETGVNYCRIGGAVYPFSPQKALISDAKFALDQSKDVSIYNPEQKLYISHSVTTQEDKARVYLSAIEKFEQELVNCDTFEKQTQALTEHMQWLARAFNYSNVGLLLYDKKNKTYSSAFEQSIKDDMKSFSRLGVIEASKIDPLYELVKTDEVLCGTDIIDLPHNIKPLFDNLGVKSFALSALVYKGQKDGLIYFFSSDTRDKYTLLEREILSIYTLFIKTSLYIQNASFSELRFGYIIDSLLKRDRKYIYTVNKNNYELSYVSSNLKAVFPDAEAGATCYRVLRTAHSAPCSGCPLLKGPDSRIIGAIGQREMSISVLNSHGVNNEMASIIIEPKNNGLEFSESQSHLVDPVLFIKNDKCLALDFGVQIKTGVPGFLVNIELADGQAIKTKLGEDYFNALLDIFSKKLQGSGYDDVLFRSSPYIFTFLLKSHRRPQIYDFVEEIYKFLSEPVKILGEETTYHFYYSVVSYPSDLDNVASLSRTIIEASKASSSFGVDKLSFINEKVSRDASREAFIIDTVKDAIVKDKFKLFIQPIVSLEKETKAVAAETLLRLQDSQRGYIPPSEFVPLASNNHLMYEIEQTSLKAIGELWQTHGFTIFRQVGVKTISFNLSADSINKPTFSDGVKAIFARYKIPKNFLQFDVYENFVLLYHDRIKTIMKELSSLGIIWAVDNYRLGNLTLDNIKDFGGFKRINIDKSVVSDMEINSEQLKDIAKFAGRAKRSGFELMAQGVENREQMEIAKELFFDLGQGFLFAKPMEKTDYIAYLNFDK